MDIQQQTTKPISDDQELAKVLAGVSRDVDNLNFEETPVTQIPITAPTAASTPLSIPIVAPIPGYNPPIDNVTKATGDSLEDIKKDALMELRPLVDKLNLSAEEKFDIYLLLLRSTDDKTLIAPAYTIAHNITDESKHAQALLDIIKEIDYLSNPSTVS